MDDAAFVGLLSDIEAVRRVYSQRPTTLPGFTIKYDLRLVFDALSEFDRPDTRMYMMESEEESLRHEAQLDDERGEMGIREAEAMGIIAQLPNLSKLHLGRHLQKVDSAMLIELFKKRKKLGVSPVTNISGVMVPDPFKPEDLAVLAKVAVGTLRSLDLNSKHHAGRVYGPTALIHAMSTFETHQPNLQEVKMLGINIGCGGQPQTMCIQASFRITASELVFDVERILGAASMPIRSLSIASSVDTATLRDFAGLIPAFSKSDVLESLRVDGYELLRVTGGYRLDVELLSQGDLAALDDVLVGCGSEIRSVNFNLPNRQINISLLALHVYMQAPTVTEFDITMILKRNVEHVVLQTSMSQCTNLHKLNIRLDDLTLKHHLESYRWDRWAYDLAMITGDHCVITLEFLETSMDDCWPKYGTAFNDLVRWIRG